MENTFERIVALTKQVERLGKTSYELYKLKSVRKLAEIASTFAFRGLIALVLMLVLLFASLGSALLIGEIVQSMYLGFLYVAIFYVVLGGVFFLLRSVIKSKISNSIIVKTLNSENGIS